MADDYREKDGKIYREKALGNTEVYEIKKSPTGEYIDTPEGIKNVDRKLSGETEITHGHRHFDNEKDVTTIIPDYSLPYAQSSRHSTEQIHPSNNSSSKSSTGYSSYSSNSSPDNAYASNGNHSSSSYEPRSQSNGFGCGPIVLILCVALFFFLFILFLQKPVPTPHKNVNSPSLQMQNSSAFIKDSPAKSRLPVLSKDQTEQSPRPLVPQSTTTSDSHKKLGEILCIMPNGNEIRVSSIECRNKNGVIYE